jgi:hypothetical protein
MSPEAQVTVVFGVIGIGTNLLIAAVIYGGLKQQTKTNSETIKDHAETLEAHEGEIGFVYGHLGLQRGK